MGNFKFDKKDTYSFEDVEKLLTDHANYQTKEVSTKLEKDFLQKENEIKKEYDSKINELSSEKTKIERDNFLGNVPEKNRDLVGDLLDKYSKEEINEKYSYLLDATKVVPWDKELLPKQGSGIDEAALVNKVKSGKFNDEEFKQYQDILISNRED